MMTTTNLYREVLEHPAKRRGLSGAEELAEKAAAAHPEYTAEDLLGAWLSGYGEALDSVLRTSEAEREIIVHAFVRTFLAGEKLGEPGDWRDLPRSEMFSRVIVAVDCARGEAMAAGETHFPLQLGAGLHHLLRRPVALQAHLGQVLPLQLGVRERQRLGPNVQTLTTPELVFRAVLTRAGASRLELARA